MYPLATKAGFKFWKWAGGLLLAVALLVGGYLYLKPSETPLSKAVSLIRAGKAAAALPILEELSRQQPANASLFPWLAQAYLSTERLGEGRTALDTAIRTRQPAETLVPVVLAYAIYYEKKEDFKEAEKILESAQGACPRAALVEGQANLYMNWADAEAKSGRLGDAVARLESAQTLLPEVSESIRTLIPHKLCEYLQQQAAIAELKSKDDAGAIALLEKSLLVSDEPATRMALANIYKRQRKFDAAIDNYRIVSQKDPNNLEARHRLVDLLVQRKDFRSAQEALVELTDRERSVENYQLLASLYLKLRNPAGAVRALEDATNLRPKDVTLLAELERVLIDWSGLLSKQGKTQESMSVKGHADRVAEMLAMLGWKKQEKPDEAEKPDEVAGTEAASAAGGELPPLDPKVPPVALYSARIWLAKGSLTPEGEIRIRNIAGRPVSDLSLTAVFYDNTRRARCGSIVLPVATPTSVPFLANGMRTLYFSCPNIVKPDHQLAVIIFWKGRLLKELPVVKQR